jgi:hypothetical protein
VAGPALELLCGFVTAPSTTQTALTMGSGNSLIVRGVDEAEKPKLLQAWTDVQGAGVFRVRSPRMHDNVQGLRFATVVSDLAAFLPDGVPEILNPQDTLVADLSGSATAGDIESAALLVYYPRLSGIDSAFATYEEIAPRIVHIFPVENTLALGTAGGYSGEEAITAEFALQKANTEYALLGYLVTTECLAVRWRGSDIGNLGIGGPGDAERRQLTRRWFVDLGRAYGFATIPIFNSQNFGNVLIDGVQDENGADTTVTSIFAELR